jgi:hypothetical protein
MCTGNGGILGGKEGAMDRRKRWDMIAVTLVVLFMPGGMVQAARLTVARVRRVVRGAGTEATT